MLSTASIIHFAIIFKYYFLHVEHLSLFANDFSLVPKK